MARWPANMYRGLCHYGHFSQIFSIHSTSSFQTLEESIKAAIKTKSYQLLPELLNSSKEPCQNPNPFSFLSGFPYDHRIQVVDEILQSFIPLRPRCRPYIVYSSLLSYTLQSPNPLPLALPILQRTLRAGCIPVPQTHLLLSSAWIDRRSRADSVSKILLEMQSIGYHPDSGTCNYLISSLCAVDQLVEAVEVLRGMGRAGCAPDLDSYGTVVSAMCTIRKTIDAVEMLKEMVVKVGLTPSQGTVVKVAAALRSNKDIWKAVDVVEFLEREGVHLGFEAYELVVEGCLECREFVLAGKVVMKMTGRGFIPYIRVRQKVVEGLAGVGELELASAVRQRFAELKS